MKNELKFLISNTVVKRIGVFIVLFACFYMLFTSKVSATDAMHIFSEDDVMYTQSIFEDSPFSDISTNIISGAWYNYYVLDVYNRNIVNGYSDGTYRPNNKITRAEAVTLLSKAYAGELTNTSGTPFNDISNHWAKNYIVWAYNMGIVNGTGNGNFSPNTYITRQDFAVMVVRYCEQAELFTLPTYASKIEFTDDSSIASYAKSSVYKLQKAGVVKGENNYTFYPYSYITRAEAAKVISVENSLLSSDGEVLNDHQEKRLYYSGIVPTAYHGYSDLYQEYRRTSNRITFYMAYCRMHVDENVTVFNDITFIPGAVGDCSIYRSNNLVASRSLNFVVQSGSNNDAYSDTVAYLPAHKFYIRGEYRITGSSSMLISNDNGNTGGASFEHSISVSF